MVNELIISKSNQIIKDNKTYEIKKICLDLCKFETEKLDFAGLVFFTKKDISDPLEWALFINSEMKAFEGYWNTLFKFKITSYIFSEESQTYELHEYNRRCLGTDLLNDNKSFCNIAFADIIKIDASAVFKKYNISYIFVRK